MPATRRNRKPAPSSLPCVARDHNRLLFIKTHDAWTHTPAGEPLFPVDVTRGVVYIVRNPLDVAVSASHHYGQSLAEMVSSYPTKHIHFHLFIGWLASCRNGCVRGVAMYAVGWMSLICPFTSCATKRCWPIRTLPLVDWCDSSAWTTMPNVWTRLSPRPDLSR